jgi:molybdate-binding protein
VHVAGLHLAESRAPENNATVAQEILNAPFRLLRVANWQEGLALAPGMGLNTVKQAVAAGLRWIGREPGSGARQVLDEVLEGAAAPSLVARDHRGVVEAVRSGLAEAGVSLRLVSEEAGLQFILVREEAYDLCIPETFEEDPRVRALIEVVRSKSLRSLLGDLPGYDSKETGEMTRPR